MRVKKPLFRTFHRPKLHIERETPISFTEGGGWQAIFLLSGMITGGLLFTKAAQIPNTYLSVFLNQYFLKCQSGEFWLAFSEKLVSVLFVQAVILLLGTSALGTPLILSVLLAKGIAAGSVFALLYEQSGMKGLFLHAIVFLIPSFLEVIVTFFFSRQACLCSQTLFRVAILGQTYHLVQNSRNLFRSFFRTTGVLIAAACLQTLSAFVFLPVFL